MRKLCAGLVITLSAVVGLGQAPISGPNIQLSLDKEVAEVKTFMMVGKTADSHRAEFRNALVRLGEAMTPVEATYAKEREGSDFSAKIMSIAWALRTDPMPFNQIFDRFTRISGNPNVRGIRVPTASAEHKTEKYRYAWEMLMIAPRFDHSHGSLIEAEQAVATIANPLSMIVFEARISHVLASGSDVKNEVELAMSSLTNSFTEEGLATILRIAQTVDRHLVTNPKLAGPADGPEFLKWSGTKYAAASLTRYKMLPSGRRWQTIMDAYAKNPTSAPLRSTLARVREGNPTGD